MSRFFNYRAIIADNGPDAYDYHQFRFRLGNGSFGTVYQVTHKREKIDYALKVNTLDYSSLNKEERKKLSNEVRAH